MVSASSRGFKLYLLARTLTEPIVAPVERREKVLREIKRPVFSLLDHGPLYEKCTFLTYDAVHAIAQEKFLTHMSDTILDEYEEHAEEG